MQLKHYTQARIAIAMVLAMGISISITLGNYILPIFLVVAGWVSLFYLRSKVNVVVADERDYAMGGNAARWTIQIYSSLAVIGMFILYSQRQLNPSFEIIATTLAYSTMALMLTYSILFRYQDKLHRGSMYKVLVIIGLLLLLLVGIRLFSGEDNWICQNGQWVKHGQPSFPAPTAECRQ